MPAKKPLTANQKIRRAMIQAEREVFAHIRNRNKNKEFVQSYFFGRVWHNALGRLQDKKRVRTVMRGGRFSMSDYQVKGLRSWRFR